MIDAALFVELVASSISKHLMRLRPVGLVLATREEREQANRIDGPAFPSALLPYLARYKRFCVCPSARPGDPAEGRGSD